MDPQFTVTLHTGNPMPILGLGTWQLTQDTAGTVEEAFRLGYRMIDTSGDYGTQTGIGEAIKHNELDRERIYLVYSRKKEGPAHRTPPKSGTFPTRAGAEKHERAVQYFKRSG